MGGFKITVNLAFPFYVHINKVLLSIQLKLIKFDQSVNLPKCNVFSLNSHAAK